MRNAEFGIRNEEFGGKKPPGRIVTSTRRPGVSKRGNERRKRPCRIEGGRATYPTHLKDFRWQRRRGSPVSIPNTEVKPFSADGTWRVTARKSRSLPVLQQRHSLLIRECFYIGIVHLPAAQRTLSARGMLAMKTYICNDVHLWYDEIIIGEG